MRTVLLTAFNGDDLEWLVGIFKEVIFFPNRITGDGEQVAELEPSSGLWKLSHPHAPESMLEHRWSLMQVIHGNMEDHLNPSPRSENVKAMLAAVKAKQWTKDWLQERAG
jgi:hypothetical protein